MLKVAEGPVTERPQDGVLVPDVALDRSSPVPLYFQVASRLQEQIEHGVLPVGGRLENEVELADRLGYLVERGMLVRRRGVGTQIVHPKVRRHLELTSLYDDLAKTGRAPRTVVRSLEVGSASAAIAQALGVPEGCPVTNVERIRYAGDDPLAIMHNVVPMDVVRLSMEDLERHGLYELLRGAGHMPRIASQMVGAKAASAVEARLLGDPRGAPMLTMTRTAWDESGQGVEFGSHVYRANRYSFELTLTC
jgi:DNA-binding GntR family transcriptional regulator